MEPLEQQDTRSLSQKLNGVEEDHEDAILSSLKALLQQKDAACLQNIKDLDLLRFLRARDYDISKAAKLFLQHVKWRSLFTPLGYVQETEIRTELERKQVFLQGHDKHGCSIVVLLTARHAALERDLEEIKRLFVYTFDKAASRNVGDQTQFLIIGDLAGWGLKNMDIRGYLAVLDILQNQYPERLRKIFLLHVPYLFWGAWKMVFPLVDKRTREKIIFVQDKDLEERLLEDIARDQLPSIYGGQLELVPIQGSISPI